MFFRPNCRDPSPSTAKDVRRGGEGRWRLDNNLHNLT